jgi:phosphoglycerate kinase
LRTLDDLDVADKAVVARVDLNVPLRDGVITDDTRIRAVLPTLERLRGDGARRLVLLAHLGRPKGGPDPAFSLAPVARRLGELLGTAVELAETPEDVDTMATDGAVSLVENVRFFDGETEDSPELAARYAATGDVFVNDAFGAAHRAHASTHAVAGLLPSAAGLLLQREVETLTGILESPERPLVAIVGGAKVTDKIGVLERFLELADTVIVGGAMIFPFFKAQGREVGSSLCEDAGVGPAQEVLAKAGDKLLLPTDLRLGRAFAADTETMDLDGVDVPEGWMGLDVGPRSAAAAAGVVRAARTVFWNGPMGAFELPPFAEGTRAVAEAVVDVETSVVGGGDSVAAVNQFGLAERATHVSTGGGASLELIEGRVLPGVEVLS